MRQTLYDIVNLIALVAIAVIFILILSVDRVDPAKAEPTVIPILPMPSPWPSESTKPWQHCVDCRSPRPTPIVIGIPPAAPSPAPLPTVPSTDTE